MMEPLVFKKPSGKKFDKSSWTQKKKKNRKSHLINSLSLAEGVVEEWNWELKKKFDLMAKKELMYEEYMTEDADVIFVAYGTSARICRSIVNQSRKEGIKTGLIRPITVWPCPSEIITERAEKTKDFCVVEMSLGQMIEDVRLAVLGNAEIHFHGRPGGGIPAESDIMKQLKEIVKK